MADEVSTNGVEEVESRRGREASNVLSYRKFVNAVKQGVILPTMERVPEVLDGNRIVTHAGYKARTFDIGVDTILLREVQSGRNQRVTVLSERELTPDEVWNAFNKPAKRQKSQETPATE